ncbi:Sm LSm8 [Fusarium subglutinans]|uniref:LSM2-LSM8 complex subunit LSM8 n=1 Tax=Gibberella subglutinans TaxID=42677 RepID=A0A8H5L1K9_GIBSU|nr:Sm LSm8 [Fusarium subglutinans]KAF5584654.1 Sm LSm8 [Fusarium subglutinans]
MATLGGYLNSTTTFPGSTTNLTSLLIQIAEKVLIVTADSRILVGTLAACDQTTNLVLNNAVERIIRTPDDPEPSAQVPLGLYLVRGDNVCSIGLVDEALDDSINWTEVKGSAIGGIKHV